MLHPLEQVRDHQNPLAHPPALASRQAPQLCRPQFAAKEVCRHRPSPQTWYAYLITLPHLGITGSRYKIAGSTVTYPVAVLGVQPPTLIEVLAYITDEVPDATGTGAPRLNVLSRIARPRGL